MGASGRAVSTGTTVPESSRFGDIVKSGPRLMKIRVLCGVHVCAHERGDIGFMRASGQTTAALAAEFITQSDLVIRQEYFLLGGIFEIVGNGKILFHMFEIVVSRNGGGDILVSQHPFEGGRRCGSMDIFSGGIRAGQAPSPRQESSWRQSRLLWRPHS